MAAIALLPLFLALGFWQLDRAGQKSALAITQDAQRALPPLRLNTAPAGYESAAYRKLLAKGEFLAEKQVMIENRKHQGKTGFHVITPLRLQGEERYLLVNRGWLSAEKGREIPAVKTPKGEVVVTGEVHIPAPPALQLDKTGEIPKSENRWPFITLSQYRLWSGLQIYPFILLQSKTDPHGFIRHWPYNRPNGTMHIGYAIQWFAFALITLMIWLSLSFTKTAEKGESRD